MDQEEMKAWMQATDEAIARLRDMIEELRESSMKKEEEMEKTEEMEEEMQKPEEMENLMQDSVKMMKEQLAAVMADRDDLRKRLHEDQCEKVLTQLCKEGKLKPAHREIAKKAWFAENVHKLSKSLGFKPFSDVYGNAEVVVDLERKSHADPAVYKNSREKFAKICEKFVSEGMNKFDAYVRAQEENPELARKMLEEEE